MLLDIGLGLLGALGWSLYSGEPLTGSLTLLAVVLVLLPDVDFLVHALKKGSFLKVDHTHRELLHHPIPYLLVGGTLVYLVAPGYLLLFLAMSLAHFVHDSTGTGWGIPWLSPLSMRHGKLFSKRNGDFSWTHAVWWTERERAAVIAKRHDPNWIRNQYGKWGGTLLQELALLLVAILAALFLL